MYLDKLSYQALNLKDINDLIEPISALGRVYIKRIKPYTCGDEIAITKQYGIIGKLMQTLNNRYDFWESARNSLLHIDPIYQVIQRAGNLKTLEIYEIFEIKNFLYFSANLRKLLLDNNLDSIQQIPNLDELFLFLDKDGQRSPAFHLSYLYSKEYAEIKAKISNLKNSLNFKMQNLIESAKQELGIDEINDKIVVSRYNKELNSLLQNSKNFSLESENFANNTYRLRKNESILQIEQELDLLNYELAIEEKKVRVEITKVISVYEDDLYKALDEVASFDVSLVKADFGNKYNCSIPEITKNRKFDLQQAVNLPIFLDLKKNGMLFQKLDFSFSNNINVLTGANMGGKTTILKLLGQFAYLAAYAIPLPCEKATVPLFDFIYFSGLQSNRMDLSSFGSEIVAVDEALQKQGFGLYLFDEFARGTNPQEGEAFSTAILKTFEKKNAICFSATHFTLPSTLKSATHYRIKGLRVDEINGLKSKTTLEARLQELHRYMDYSLEKVEAGAEPPRSAMMIAAFLGVDIEIINCAKNLMKEGK